MCISVNVHRRSKIWKNTKAMVCSDHPGAMGLGNGTWEKGNFYFLLL